MHHNGDPSHGNVRFFLPNWIADATHHPHAGPDEVGMAEVHIPFEAIRLLVLNYYRNELINALEQAEGEELEQLVVTVALRAAANPERREPDKRT